MMSSVLENAIKQQMERLSGLSFQEFIEELFIIKHPKDFIPVKQKRDKGADGFLNRHTILAVYAPEKPDLTLFKKKIQEDYDKYIDNFSRDYPHWKVIYNGIFTTDRVKFVYSLRKDAELIGSKHLLKFIHDLPWYQKRRIADYLDISRDFLENDVLKTVIDDLIQFSATAGDHSPGYGKAVYIEDKVRLNFREEDSESMLEEYEDSLGQLNRVRDIIKPYGDNLGALKFKIREDYKTHRHRSRDFKSTMDTMTDIYSEKYPKDDLYKYYVRLVLIYFFEQCLIGEKSVEEKDAAAAS